MHVRVEGTLKVFPELPVDLPPLRDTLAGRMPNSTVVVDEPNGCVVVTFTDPDEVI